MDFDITSLLNKSSGSKDAKTNGKTTKKVSSLNFFKVNRKIQCIISSDENGYFDINNDIYFHDSFSSLLFSVIIMYVLYSLLPNHFLYHLLSARLFYSIHYWLLIASYWYHLKGLIKVNLEFSFSFSGFSFLGLNTNIYSGLKPGFSIHSFQQDQYFIFQVSKFLTREGHFLFYFNRPFGLTNSLYLTY